MFVISLRVRCSRDIFLSFIYLFFPLPIGEIFFASSSFVGGSFVIFI